MPELAFAVEGAAAVPHCATPTLGFALRITNRRPDRVRALLLECQVRLDAHRRRYGVGEQERLEDLFGEPRRWPRTLRSLLWAQVNVSVPPFEDSAAIDLPVPCTADLAALEGRYFSALEGGSVPVSLLFSGSVFHEAGGDGLQVARVPRSAECAYDLPVAAWREVVDLYFPGVALVALRRDLAERLQAYRARRGLPTLEHALEHLLGGEPRGA